VIVFVRGRKRKKGDTSFNPTVEDETCDSMVRGEGMRNSEHLFSRTRGSGEKRSCLLILVSSKKETEKKKDGGSKGDDNGRPNPGIEKVGEGKAASNPRKEGYAGGGGGGS